MVKEAGISAGYRVLPGYLLVFCLVLLPHTGRSDAFDVRNVINRFGTPVYHQDFDQYGNQRFNPLLDMGAWHGFLLPDSPETLGSFTGPMIIAEEYPIFIASALEKLHIRQQQDGEVVNLAGGNKHLYSAPGSLHQSYQVGDLQVALDLRFITNRTALVSTRLTNSSNRQQVYELTWSGRLLDQWSKDKTVNEAFPQWQRVLEATKSGLTISFSKVRSQWQLMQGGEAAYIIHRSVNAISSVDEKNPGYSATHQATLEPRPGFFCSGFIRQT